MVTFNLKHIDKGPAKSKVGHNIFLRAKYVDGATQPLSVIYKENTNHNPALSLFEVAFSIIARFFLAPNLTAPAGLVKNDEDEVVGIVSEHITSVIARRELQASANYYQMDTGFKHKEFTTVSPQSTDQIPYRFLDECHPLFFHRLREAEKAGTISLDLDSLAEILCASYMLEEDDLHKGNIGFYAVEQNGKPHLKFFKIDHDYLFSGSVMSHFKTRMINAFYDNEAYTISKRDLLNFPVLQDSKNYYWPTMDHLLNIGQKAYHAKNERMAYAGLAASEAFQQAKWNAFYRQILIPPALIQEGLEQQLDKNNPAERAHMALIMQALVARQARLRAVLFSMPDFRCFVSTLDDSVELIKAMHLPENSSLNAEIHASIAKHQVICRDGTFDEKDTPLHVAIKLQDYRYHDTWQAFGHYAEQKNTKGQRPLDVAAALLDKQQLDTTDLRGDALCTMKHLMREGATDAQGKSHAAFIKPSDYLFHSDYAKRARSQEDVAQLIALLRDLGEDVRYSLKMQKELAVICIRQFALEHGQEKQLGHMMLELKMALNGSAQQVPAPELQYIRQLRSQLWIVRYIRGLLGGTSTQQQINRFIDQTLISLRPSLQSSSTLFYNKTASESHSSSEASFESGSSITANDRSPSPDQ